MCYFVINFKLTPGTCGAQFLALDMKILFGRRIGQIKQMA